MTYKTVLLGCALAAALSLPAQAVVLANAGFETGTLSGWTSTDGYVEVVTQADDALGGPPFGELFTATEGDYFARLTAGPVAGTYTTLSQAFTLTAVSLLSFDTAFLAFDYDLYNDDGYVRIFSSATNQVVFASSVLAVGDQGHTAWARFTSGPLGVGAYVLEAGVRNVGDPDAIYSSQLLLDNVSVSATGPIPEPATWAMMIIGFGGVGAMVRSRRRVGSAVA